MSPFRSEQTGFGGTAQGRIRKLVHPVKDQLADLKVDSSHYFRVVDKVMHTKNNAKASLVTFAK